MEAAGVAGAQAGEGAVWYNKKAGFKSGLSATFYTENSTKICFRCRAADLRLSTTHGLTTAFFHRQCPYHSRTPIPRMSPVVGTTRTRGIRQPRPRGIPAQSAIGTRMLGSAPLDASAMYPREMGTVWHWHCISILFESSSRYGTQLFVEHMGQHGAYSGHLSSEGVFGPA